MYVLFFEKFDFVITLVSVLKDVTKFVLKFFLERCLCEKFLLFEQVLKILPTRKKIVHSRFL